jgi:hypothetical protein
MEDNKSKICPLIKQYCISGKCNLFNEKLKRCDISLLNYNLYRLFEVESKRVDVMCLEDGKSSSTRKKDDPWMTPVEDLV